LAVNYYQLGWYNEAEESIFKAIGLDNLSERNYHLLDLIKEKTKNYSMFIEDYHQSIEKYPQSIDAYNHLGNIYLRQEKIDKAIEIYKIAIERVSLSCRVPIYYRLGNIYKSIENNVLAQFYWGYFAYYKKQYKTAISYFEEFLANQVGDINTYIMMAHSYVLTDQPLSAIILIDKALKLFPDSLLLKRINQVVLPIIYKNTEEIKFYRQRFCQLLNKLIKEIKLHTSKEKQAAIDSIQVITNFYLGYQGENDLEIQSQYGNYLYQVVSQIYPQWCQLVNLDQNSNDKRIRVGYISSRLDGLGILYLGWLKYCDKSKFEIYIYDISGSAENIKKNNLQLREDLRKYSHNFKFVSGTIDNICATLVSDKLDILIFTELGLDPQMTLLSCLRLAPIQCTTWGQPMTSGSPNVDYFLSSNLMEPDNGEEHYSETLIRLPNLGFAFESPVLPLSNKQGIDFQLKKEDVIYLCCQALFKYLPQYDYIFPSIVQQNKLAQFVFMDSYLGPVITNSFRKRIDKSFAKFDLNYEDYCVFLRQVKFDDFLRLNQLADIFLDSFGWSGGITTKDAIACSLPIVTCPGQMMRARQSYGMLRMIGVTETIAKTEAEYIEIAVRLGLDHEWRQRVREKMTANKHRLFNDQECIQGLESFFQEAIQKHSKII
jgi:predicted O-linked N-acetylglucosamine transferase (SPINDLY family)